ncbi:MAG: hypothetical protein WAL15_20270 [Xanthobacteraceae bacterium]|jgi:hypothetical protein
MTLKNYVAGLLNAAGFLKSQLPVPQPETKSAQPAFDSPKPYAEPTGRPGRPNSLNSKRFGELLKAIAEENSKNQTFKTDDGIAGKLIGRPEYQDLSPRQLRRKVGQAIDWEIDQLKTISPDRWNDFFGIAPPQKMTRQFLRAKAFEHLRNELGRHNESMAKKP